MIRGLPTTIGSTLLAGAVGIGLFFVKHEVKEQEARLAELNSEIERNQEAIHVLKAEWSYLNDPARLRALSEKYLAMKVMGAGQVASLDHLPAMEPAPAYATAEHPRPAVAQAAAAPQPAPVKLAAVPAPAKAPPANKAAAKPTEPHTPPVAAQPAVAPSAVARAAAPAPSHAALAVAAQPQPTPQPQPQRRSIVIQSPALAATPALPGDAR